MLLIFMMHYTVFNNEPHGSSLLKVKCLRILLMGLFFLSEESQPFKELVKKKSVEFPHAASYVRYC